MTCSPDQITAKLNEADAMLGAAAAARKFRAKKTVEPSPPHRTISVMLFTLPSTATMNRAMRRRDAAFDGVFYVCVTTTRIFCRPSCPARKPMPRNVVFHASVRDCLMNGFRPCRRCRPLASAAEDGTWLEPLMQQIDNGPARRFRDADLRALGISPHRVRRYFNRNFGMTFQALHRMRRMGSALEELRTGSRELAVGLAHGFESSSGFRDAFERLFGTTPGRSAHLAAIRIARLDTPLGPMVGGATEEGLCFLEFADRRALATQAAALRKRLNAVMAPGTNDHLLQVRRELHEYFAGRLRAFAVPLALHGTSFQMKVWSALRAIPYGETRSYEQLAQAIGMPGACRAVGRTNGANRIPIVVPCHRVIGADGKLTGYGGGLWRKKWLLDHERNQEYSGHAPNPGRTTV